LNQTAIIECKLNGPYIVKDLDNLRDSRGTSLPATPVMALCRCGGSASKPFCDGTHRKNGFSGTKVHDASADERDHYPGQRVTIHDNRTICAHAGRCTEGLASVFRHGSRPWIDADGAPLTAIIETVRKCPSGALSYSIDGDEHRDLQRAPAITVTRDGPYAVTGGVQLINQSWGQGASTEHYTLCRCGGSKNKPFCDGTHLSLGFKDDKS
jgi:CDGSH-type Zn-finger protein